MHATSLSVPSVPSDKISASPATMLLSSGIPGYSYTFVDPDEQYQKYLCVVIQALSGTDPLKPPDLQATITDDGMNLTVHLPISPVFLSTELMVHKNVSWMRSKSENDYNSKKQTRLGGLGPTIAQVKGKNPSTPPSIVWNIPLSEGCDELVGSYSISNFPAETNEFKQTFSPVLMEFKLSTVEQNVKKESRVNSSLWIDDTNYIGNSSTGNSNATYKQGWNYTK